MSKRQPNYSEKAKIKILVDDNPKRAGSAAALRFSKYKNGMTVGAALEAGISSADLHWDSEHEFIRIGGRS